MNAATHIPEINTYPRDKHLRCHGTQGQLTVSLVRSRSAVENRSLTATRCAQKSANPVRDNWSSSSVDGAVTDTPRQSRLRGSQRLDTVVEEQAVSFDGDRYGAPMVRTRRTGHPGQRSHTGRPSKAATVLIVGRGLVGEQFEPFERRLTVVECSHLIVDGMEQRPGESPFITRHRIRLNNRQFDGLVQPVHESHWPR